LTPRLSRPLDDRVAVVTGANSGIGRGIAESFAEAGAKVVISGRTQDRNELVAKTINAAGGEALALAADVTQEDDIVALLDRTMEAYGRLDICVANSGGTADYGMPEFVDMDTNVWRGVLSLNLDAVFIMFREAVRKMLSAGNGGSLISVSSVSSIRSVGDGFHYGAAKAGVNALSMALAEYLGPHNIRINTIIPGFIQAASTEFILAVPEIRAGIEQRIPMRRIGLPSDVGALATFLASDESSFITGQSFVIDGGQSPRMVNDPPPTLLPT
jgi:NAD(P)-dependent dehydrogenase (short-subunit alcohol dehydrogenase family)